MKRLIHPAISIDAAVSLPGSKYLANRLVIIAALAREKVVLTNVVANDDIDTAIKGLNKLGYRLVRNGSTVESYPRLEYNDVSADAANVYTSHSGTFSRFVTALAALESRPVNISGSNKMNSRPMEDLFTALRTLGVSIDSRSDTLPAVIQGPITHHRCQIKGQVSSQYVSALLLIAPNLGYDFYIDVIGEKVSTQYIGLTIDLMRQFGAVIEPTESGFFIPKQNGYCGREVSIAPDPVSSSYFLGAAAICGGKITLQEFDKNSIQGEAKFYRILEQMGCEVELNQQSISLTRSQPLKAVDLDMGEMPDVVQTLAAVACFAEGTTVMKNIAHLAFKESNRIVDTAKELRKLGVPVEYGEDYLAVTGCLTNGSDIMLKGAVLETHDDHRMAMSLSLIGTQVSGVIINSADVVSKSFPTYFDKLNELGIETSVVD
ncbi:MAG: 3-phosphoshikimate 1-carboxyvinyltransferase [Gammaproteobacteria bacterium]|nr:3-phosphoshikimate 1-carboxyvinyltransferase [Gammaproteobacteria bacterium]